eukprot:11447700-Alexandrium_andersonii.AAC.1
MDGAACNCNGPYCPIAVGHSRVTRLLPSAVFTRASCTRGVSMAAWRGDGAGLTRTIITRPLIGQ